MASRLRCRLWGGWFASDEGVPDGEGRKESGIDISAAKYKACNNSVTRCIQILPHRAKIHYTVQVILQCSGTAEQGPGKR